MAACHSDHPGEQQARKYCSTCHLFPEPALLDKTTWQLNVLPAMGKLIGVNHPGNDPFEGSGYTFEKHSPLIGDREWQEIIAFYLAEAPDSNEAQHRAVISSFTKRFLVKHPPNTGGIPENTFIKIDPGNQWMYVANRFDSSLYVYNRNISLIKTIPVHDILVSMDFNNSLLKPGVRDGMITKIGIMEPNDYKTGKVNSFHIMADGSFSSQLMYDTLQRPVESIAADLDKDGKKDYIICAFGNKSGGLYWMNNKGNGIFRKMMLRSAPGVIRIYLGDFDGNGFPDIMALFTQAQEGIYLFLNKGNGVFTCRLLVEFPPVYGSSYFELQDMNNDGKIDIVYTCGDNADYSGKALKSYHGIYVFINTGNFSFVNKYFFPIHGAYKAMSRDFDKDGDLDIAVISFFPDRKHQPEESFVYLENKGDLKFEASTIHEVNEGHWITMDAGDLDNDGDDDLVIGSLFLPYEISNNKPSFLNKPLFLFLENQTVKPASIHQ